MGDMLLYFLNFFFYGDRSYIRKGAFLSEQFDEFWHVDTCIISQYTEHFYVPQSFPCQSQLISPNTLPWLIISMLVVTIN